MQTVLFYSIGELTKSEDLTHVTSQGSWRKMQKTPRQGNGKAPDMLWYVGCCRGGFVFVLTKEQG